ncbi:hypothetical protein MWU49_05260 [Alcanivorax sp. S6407]|uniref:hypothetical protein n=1 Tax=Alcanivorax sp. S6407 TaxID=2926424 RepID=UPI001FF16CE2|nr:hypothetical protein [Alcanivorax sp. S6407]MCK0153100.1 hypothetical protein [Alcanivorax sp. S6407]
MASLHTLSSLPPRTFLASHRQDELDALFATLPAAQPSELQGEYQGTLFGIRGLSGLPVAFKGMLYRLLATWLNPWEGKQFDGDNGANLWGHGRLQGRWGQYRIQPHTDNAVLALDYNVDGNPALLRPILGEVRRFQDGLFLARMRYRTRRDTHTLLYFTLQETH